MFSFFNKDKEEDKIIDPYIKIAALLIHAAKIDENYTEKENKIIIKALINLGSNKDKINELVGMFQKEVAERVVCENGRKKGILSILIQTFYKKMKFC